MGEQFSFQQLCELANFPERKVRYYIQQGIVDSPIGAKRNAVYTHKHLEQLITIQHWQKAGLSLEKIKAILTNESANDLPPEPTVKPGSVQVVNKIMICEGVTLEVDTLKTKLNSEQLRILAKKTIESINTIIEGN